MQEQSRGWCVYAWATRGQRGTVLTVGGVMGTARYLHTARILEFGGRFDSEGVGLARIHIPQLSAWTAGRDVCLCRPQGRGGGWNRSRVCDVQGGLTLVGGEGAAASGGHWEKRAGLMDLRCAR